MAFSSKMEIEPANSILAYLRSGECVGGMADHVAA